MHHRLAGRVVRVRAGQLVNPWTVQVHFTLVVHWVTAEVALELFQGSVHVDAWMSWIVRNPHGDWATPVAVTGDGPVASVGQPLAELTVLDVFWDPVDLLVDVEELILDLGDGDEPGGHWLVDQWGSATPAVWVGMNHGLALHEQCTLVFRNACHDASVVTKVAQDRCIRVEDLQALIIWDQRGKACRIICHIGDVDVVRLERVHIVFAVRSLVNQTSTFFGVDVIGSVHSVSILARLSACLFGQFALQVWHGRVVAAAHEFGTLESAKNLIIFTQFLSEVSDASLSKVELLASKFAGNRLDFDVIDVVTHHDGHVGWHGPWGGRPIHEVGVFIAQTHAQDDGCRLLVGVHVAVHAQLMCRERGFILWAVWQDAVAFVDEALVVQLLEGPDDGLHVADVHRLVATVEINPAGLAVDVFFPFARVLHHGATACVIKGCQAELVDLVLVGEAELFLGFQFCWQAVSIPAEDALHAAAFHGLVAWDDVLRVAGQKVTVMWQAIGEWRAVEEHVLIVGFLTRWVDFQ